MYSININLPYPLLPTTAPTASPGRIPQVNPLQASTITLQTLTNTIQASTNTLQSPIERPNNSQNQNRLTKSRSPTPVPYVCPTRSTLKPKLRSGEHFLKPKKPYEEWHIEELHRQLKKAQTRVAELQETLVKVALQYTEGQFDSETEPESEEEEQAGRLHGKVANTEAKSEVRRLALMYTEH
ncbi:hypothetical protein M422DRAFT_48501 [Sphaerobolus stellatus SS14]|uniref:Uncharacterized protein n=1 Tax=Sphaerobolus stellatus (strain SS14) TaxID=990650 RepID=A0A0C9V4N7_SPHS4|nr:hypothetical protein M422DRAFT_48501 [Sphaerobolus stellatus SS14]